MAQKRRGSDLFELTVASLTYRRFVHRSETCHPPLFSKLCTDRVMEIMKEQIEKPLEYSVKKSHIMGFNDIINQIESFYNK